MRSGRWPATLFVIDRDRRRVVWAADREHGIDWEEDVEPIEEHLVDAAEQYLEGAIEGRRAADAAAASGRRVGRRGGEDRRRSGVRRRPLRGRARRATAEARRLSKGLSKREREIARLLVAGYSGVNVAAISGLSENTVRTYVRRLYGKLGVNNRADLVRKLLTPESSASSASPTSPIAPPPDSSLIAGDDMLD